MAERQLVERDFDEARLLGGGERAQVGAGALQHGEVAGLLGRGEREQPARRLRERADPGRERLLDAGLDAVSGGELDQRERVAERDLEDPVGVAGREGLAGVLLEDRRGGVAVEASQDDRVEALRQLVAGPRRDQQRDRVGEQAPGGEQDRPERRLVDPLGVVDRHEQRALLGAQREQAQRRDADQEAVAVRAGREAQRAFQRRGLRLGQLADPVQRGPQQRVQAGERDLGLGLDPARSEHGHLARVLDGVLEQRRLPDPGLARDHEHLARAEPGGREQLLDASQLLAAPDHHVAILCARSACCRGATVTAADEGGASSARVAGRWVHMSA